jgi:hypothetical protein
MQPKDGTSVPSGRIVTHSYVFFHRHFVLKELLTPFLFAGACPKRLFPAADCGVNTSFVLFRAEP